MTVYWYDRLGFNGHMGLKVVLVITGVVYVIYKNNKTNNNFKADLSDFQSSVVCKLSTTFTVIFLTLCVCIYHLECVTFIQWEATGVRDMHNISSEQFWTVCWFKRATLYSLFRFILKSLSFFFLLFFLLDKPGHVSDLIYAPLVRSSADTNGWDEFLGVFEAAAPSL